MTRALVTGVSSGIGLHTAVGLAAAGLEVIGTLRELGRGSEVRRAAADAGVEIELVELEVTDADACARVIEAAGAIDVLVNNAGRGSVATLEQLTDDDLRTQLEVNLVAVARLSRLALRSMRERGAGRIVTVTSVGGAVGQPFADAYCAAKFGVEGLMQSLAPVAARLGVDVSIVEPAAVASGFVGSASGSTDIDALDDDPYAAMLSAYLKRSAAVFRAAQPAIDAARVVVEAATTASPRFRWQTSPGAAAFVGRSLSDLDGAAVLDTTSTWLD